MSNWQLVIPESEERELIPHLELNQADTTPGQGGGN
jgi:hypothetical protein